MKAFISYNHKDREKALAIKKILDHSSIETFLDKDTLKFSDSIDTYIQRIEESTHLICFFSRNYFKSSYCLFELTKAFISSDKKIVAVVEDEGLWNERIILYAEQILLKRKKKLGSIGNKILLKLKRQDLKTGAHELEIERINYFLDNLHKICSALSVVTLVSLKNFEESKGNALMITFGINTSSLDEILEILEQSMLQFNDTQEDPIPESSTINFKGNDELRYNANRIYRIEQLYIKRPTDIRLRKLKALILDSLHMSDTAKYFQQ